jgi:hypothetical protein
VLIALCVRVSKLHKNKSNKNLFQAAKGPKERKKKFQKENEAVSLINLPKDASLTKMSYLPTSHF